jgi:hypothetical protein
VGFFDDGLRARAMSATSSTTRTSTSPSFMYNFSVSSSSTPISTSRNNPKTSSTLCTEIRNRGGFQISSPIRTTQVHRGEHYDDDKHASEHPDRDFLDFREQPFQHDLLPRQSKHLCRNFQNIAQEPRLAYDFNGIPTMLPAIRGINRFEEHSRPRVLSPDVHLSPATVCRWFPRRRE